MTGAVHWEYLQMAILTCWHTLDKDRRVCGDQQAGHTHLRHALACRRLQHHDGPGALGAPAEGPSGGQPAVCGDMLAGAQL